MAAIALLLLMGLPATSAWARKRRCVQNCGPVIAACIENGGRPRACRRRILRQCAHMVQVHVSLESHQGATEMTLGGQWSVLANDARYQVGYCFYPGDPCEDRIGVPTNGSASCSLLFEVPLTATSGRLDYAGYRYSASAQFPLP